jgi:ribokinase
MDTSGLPGAWLAAHQEDIFSAFDVVVIQQESFAGIAGGSSASGGVLVWLKDCASGARWWPEVVIVSNGSDGACLFERGCSLTHCTIAAIEIRDETGAADALVGTFLAMWMHGVPPDAALKGACAAAALVATEYGAQELRPSGNEIAPGVASMGYPGVTYGYES